MLFANGADRIEIGALVVRDVGRVMAEQVPSPFADQVQERLIPERAAVRSARQPLGMQARRAAAGRRRGILRARLRKIAVTS